MQQLAIAWQRFDRHSLQVPGHWLFDVQQFGMAMQLPPLHCWQVGQSALDVHPPTQRLLMHDSPVPQWPSLVHSTQELPEQ